MANGAVTGIAGTIAGAISSLTPTQTLLLGGHLTASNEAKALGLINSIQQNPALAGAFMGTLAAIPNLPQVVMTYVGQALANMANPALFQQYMNSAQVELVKALASENAIQQAFGI